VLAGVSALSAFAMFALAGTILARLLGAAIARRLEGASPASRARVLFRLCLLPGAAAGIAAFAVALPIFLWFEEPGTVEPVSRTLAVVAAAGAYLLFRGLWRAGAASRATARVVRRWEHGARRIEGLAPGIQGYGIDEAFPTVAVAGFFRPRLFVAERVLREFTAGEIRAMIAHECAHVTSRDNVKRLLVRMCPHVFTAMGQLEREWVAAAEEAADSRAAALAPSARLDLAQALIRVTRMARPRAPELISAFYLGGSIDHRIRRLLNPSADTIPAGWTRGLLPGAAILFVGVVVVTAPALHAFMEAAVRRLP
jgi:Zn-dependent protease with chaperone function